jgi:AcrR family transcriptional regulator
MPVNIHRTVMAGEKRRYRKTRRAEQEQSTRTRIIESIVALHSTLGPSATTVSGIARHAGVRRSTIYRHFPDEASMFEACSSHWRADNPLPDIACWAAVSDPNERLKLALVELYAHYRQTQQMMDNLMRDYPAMPIIQRTFKRFLDYMALAMRTLMVGRSDSPGTAAAIGHALAFTTWSSLVREQGLDDEGAVDLMSRMVAASGQESTPTAPSGRTPPTGAASR